jgi:hypothetical protein
MHRTRISVVLLLLGIAIAGCGPSNQGSGPSPTQRTGLYAPITLEEIQASHATNGYDLLRALRPNWLQARGQTRVGGYDQVVVYMNMVRMGGVETLRNVNAVDVRVVEFMDARRAMLRFGSGHEGGVIVVSTRT